MLSMQVCFSTHVGKLQDSDSDDDDEQQGVDEEVEAPMPMEAVMAPFKVRVRPLGAVAVCTRGNNTIATLLSVLVFTTPVCRHWA